MAQVLANDEVRTALSQTLVDRLYQQSNVTERLSQRLPPNTQKVAPIIAAALRADALRVTEAFLGVEPLGGHAPAPLDEIVDEVARLLARERPPVPDQ